MTLSDANADSSRESFPSDVLSSSDEPVVPNSDVDQQGPTLPIPPDATEPAAPLRRPVLMHKDAPSGRCGH